MKTLTSLILFTFASLTKAAPLWLGTNQVAPGKIVEFVAPLNAKGRWEASRIQRKADVVRGGLLLPERFELRTPCPLLIVSVPSGGSSIGSLRQYTNVAWNGGWAVLAVDGPRIKTEEDTIQWGWAMLSSGLDYLGTTWPQSKQWPAACAGFSGGAKRSAAVGAAMMREGYRVIGIFMGGCNEDRATLGLQLFQPGAAFKSVPLFLSNGASDSIANPQHGAEVRASMLRSGFTRIRLETHEGGHSLKSEHLQAALVWFRQLADGKR